MNRFARSRHRLPTQSRRRGFTLIEVLVATLLSLMLLGAVIQLFATVSTSITQSRAVLESADRLRATQNQLQRDLEGLTVTPMPPRRSEFNEGYLEIIEGQAIQGQYFVSRCDDTTKDLPTGNPNNSTAIPRPVNAESSNTDTSVGDFDDILMFTTRSSDKPFTGRYNGVMIESNVAEVAWFVRGTTLHRRVLLVAPHLVLGGTLPFYEYNDISARMQGSNFVPNTLGDLSRRECRYAHYGLVPNDGFPWDIRRWGQLGLPTLRESASSHGGINNPNCGPGNWTQVNSGTPTATIVPNLQQQAVDFWTLNLNSSTGTNPLPDNALLAPGDDTSTRIADDIILTNVIGFNVKVWDSGVIVLQDTQGVTHLPGDPNYGSAGSTPAGLGAYVDMGYESKVYNSKNPAANPTPIVAGEKFYHLGDLASGLEANVNYPARVYDTWANNYDDEFYTNAGVGFRANDGFDNGGVGIIDNDAERFRVTPYAAPLRGIQVIIRIFEPDSRQIREVTIEQDFLPK